jgi:hypothetical protein
LIDQVDFSERSVHFLKKFFCKKKYAAASTLKPNITIGLTDMPEHHRCSTEGRQAPGAIKEIHPRN